MNPVFGEPADIEIDWVIEGQPSKSQMTSKTPTDILPFLKNKLIIFFLLKIKYFQMLQKITLLVVNTC
jgi:hypothetical protein